MAYTAIQKQKNHKNGRRASIYSTKTKLDCTILYKSLGVLIFMCALIIF